MSDLAGVLQRLNGAERLLERHQLVDAVQLPQVDLLDAEPAQAHLDALPQVLRSRELLPDTGAASGEPALGPDDHAVVRVQRLAEKVLGDVGAVAVGRVDEVDTELDRSTQDGEGGVMALRRSPDALARDAHGAESEAVHLQVAAEGERAGGLDDGRGGHAAPRVRGATRQPYPSGLISTLT